MRWAVILVLASGCSFIVVKGVPSDQPVGMPPSCTRVPIAPIVDTGLAALAIFGAVVAHQKLGGPEGGEFPNNDFLRMQRGFALIGAAIEITAAGYGFIKTAQCRRARSDYSSRVNAR